MQYSRKPPQENDDAQHQVMPKQTHLQRDSKYLNSLHLTSTILCAALFEEKSRRVWEQYAKNKELSSGSSIPVRAIARAMSDFEHRTYGLEVSPQQYKNRVSRATSTGQMSMETLDLLCKTFDFSQETVRSLQQAVMHGFDDSESLQIIRTIAQVMVSSSYFDVYLSETDPVEFEVKVTLTLLSLEAGCSAVLFPFADIQDITCETPGVHVLSTPVADEWIFFLDDFVPPQETFMLRFIMRGRVSKTPDGFYTARSPFFMIRVFSTGIKVNTGGAERTVRIEKTLATDSESTLVASETVTDYLTYYCPAIDDSSIVIKWK